MSHSSPDLTIGLSAPATATVGRSNGPTEIEREVIGLFDQLRDRLLRYVLAFGVSAHDGEEIIQEVFLALFQHLRSGRSRRNLRGWVFRVAHNLTLKQRLTSRRSQDRMDFSEGIAERQPDVSPNPEEQLIGMQRETRLRAVLQVLPELDRRCLRLRAEGLRYREIAGVLGISLGAVSISLTRSLERMGRADES
jgi:RNA polymerase sigma-70 factor, ECF subfamily